ncbi:Serine-aspartate repeat-containing protein C [Anaerolineales bacterium]|nr:Serine-aspartate repeat-containing protein C [Anaerolineales bacterium]
MLKRRNTNALLITGIIMLVLLACASAGGGLTVTATEPAPAKASAEVEAATPTTIPPTAIPTPQPFAAPSSFGPDREDFPAGYNPLSGQPVEDPGLLQMPAMLLSISHFPPVARPQAGLSFAPWVFEFYITEGATRFLGVFHGAFPEPEIPVSGDCEVRREPFTQSSSILGNQVWLDENKNGRQEPYEPGVGGICVNLYDEANQLVESTTTDNNGYYGFNAHPGKHTVEFLLPEWLGFTSQNIGDENADSDADPLSGRADVEIQSTYLLLDAGLIPSDQPIPTPGESVQIPKAEVGPIRSGRLLYADIANFFQDSCLIYAFASKEVLSELPQCSMVAHEDAGGGAMMPLERLRAVAEDNMHHTRGGFNYASNLFSEAVPAGGTPANQINVYVALLNQSGWIYDPLYGAWLRFVDNADNATAGQLHADTDRLTGRQLHFENFIIIFAEVDVVSPTNLDIHLEQGDEGRAILFRDGMRYDIKWSTRSDNYEQNTGQRRPMKFINADGSPAPLKPGSTWIYVATPYSIVSDEGGGTWKLRYYPPEGSE